MGYYFHSTGSGLKFKEPVSEDAVSKLADFLRISDPEHDAGLRSRSGWNEMTPIEKLEVLLDYEGWTLEPEYESVFFEFSKDSDAEEMWEMLAPYIEEDSYIDMIGEDDCAWRFAFDGEKMEVQYADDTFFPGEDDFSAERANELLKKMFRTFSGYGEDWLAITLNLNDSEKLALHRIMEKKGDDVNA